MVVEVHASQIVVRLLCQRPLLTRCFYQSPIILIILKQIIRVRFKQIRWRLLYGVHIGDSLYQGLILEDVQVTFGFVY